MPSIAPVPVTSSGALRIFWMGFLHPPLSSVPAKITLVINLRTAITATVPRQIRVFRFDSTAVPKRCRRCTIPLHPSVPVRYTTGSRAPVKFPSTRHKLAARNFTEHTKDRKSRKQPRKGKQSRQKHKKRRQEDFLLPPKPRLQLFFVSKPYSLSA